MPRKPRSYIEPGVSKRVTRAETAKAEPPPPAQAPTVPTSRPKPRPVAKKAAPKPVPKKKTTTRKRQASTKKPERKPGSKQGPAAKRVRGPLGTEESNAAAGLAEDLPGIDDEADVSDGDNNSEEEEKSSPAAQGILTSSGYVYSSWPEAAAIISKRIGSNDTSLEQFGYRPKNFIRRNIRVAETGETTEDDTTLTFDTDTAVPASEQPVISSAVSTNGNITTGARETRRPGSAKKQLTTVIENSETDSDAESSEEEKERSLDVVHINSDNLNKQPTAQRSSITPRTLKSITQPSAESQITRSSVSSDAATQQISESRRITRSSSRVSEQAPTSTSTAAPVAELAQAPVRAQSSATPQKRAPAKNNKKKKTMEPGRPTKNLTQLQGATSEALDTTSSAVSAASTRWTEPPLVQDAGSQRQTRSSTRISDLSLKRRLEKRDGLSTASKRHKKSTESQASPPMPANGIELDELQQAIQRAADVDSIVYQPCRAPPHGVEGKNSAEVQTDAAVVAASAEPQRGLSPPSIVFGDAYCDPEQQGLAQNRENHVLFFAYDRLMAEDHMKREYSDDVVPCGIGKLEGWRFCLAGPRRLGVPRPKRHEISGEGYANIVESSAEMMDNTSDNANAVSPPPPCVYGRVYSVPQSVWKVLKKDLQNRHHGATVVSLNDPIDLMQGMKHDMRGNVVPLSEQYKYRNFRLGGLHDTTEPEWPQLSDPLEHQETLYKVRTVYIPPNMYHTPDRVMSEAASAAGYDVMQSYYGEQDKVIPMPGWPLQEPEETEEARAERLENIRRSTDVHYQIHLLRDHERQAYKPILKAHLRSLEIEPKIPPPDAAKMLLDLRPQLDATKRIFLSGKLLRSARRRQVREARLAAKGCEWMNLPMEERRLYETQDNWEKKLKRLRQRRKAARLRAAAAGKARLKNKARGPVAESDSDDSDDLDGESFSQEDKEEELQPRLHSIMDPIPTLVASNLRGATYRDGKPLAITSGSRPYSRYNGYDRVTEEEEDEHERYMTDWDNAMVHIRLERLIPLWYISEVLRAWIPKRDRR